ncbi:MAG: hypothetical protein JSU70_03965 [Phycisphaerales bacterium]|nr:MAG: hypothetical protein JSU70_03965 [Phycisphaerales bacterium]
MNRIVLATLATVLIYGTTCMAAVGYDDVNKDVHNDSSEPAYGFRILLEGVHDVIWHFDGYPDGWRFDNFDSRVVVEGDGRRTTVLQWSQPLNPAGEPEPIPPCTWVHIGYRLMTQADIGEVCWTDESGGCIADEGYIRQPTQTIDLIDGVYVLTIKNALRDGLPLSIGVVGYRLSPGALRLDELNRRNPTLNPSVAGNYTPFPGAEGVIVLDSGESRSFEIPIVPGTTTPTTTLIICKKNKNFVDISQHVPGPRDGDGPTLTQWGLIIMVLALLTVGAVVIARRRRVAA